jgi:hypothetical protein
MGTVNTLLAEHVNFRVTCVDRVGIAGYIRGLQYEGGVVKFILQRGFPIPSPVVLTRNHDRLVGEVDRFVKASALTVVRFRKGDVKEDIARPFQEAAAAAGRPGVVLVGKAQERMEAWVGYKDSASRLGTDRHPHFAFSRQAKVPDHWYFYLHDDQWGPVLVKLAPFAPYPLWIVTNGHQWLKRQLAAAGVEFQALDNGLRSVGDPALAHRLAARLSAGHLRAGIERWLEWIPSPLLRSDRQHGFGYEFSVRQLEISDTAVFDAPRRGRAWFEAAIRDHLDLGRPEQVALVVDRHVRTRGHRPTPGRFATEVVAQDINPKLQIHYKSSKAKCYLKEGRALRVETTINNPTDFGTLKTLNAENWKVLRRIGADTNARFLAALGEGQAGLPDPASFESLVMPTVHDGQRAPGLRFGDPRVMALLSSIAAFAHVMGGLTNRTLREHMSVRWNPDYTTNQATYDLRRLRLKGLIERIDGTNTYRVTGHGRTFAIFLTKLAARVIIPTLTDFHSSLAPPPSAPRPLITAWHDYEHRLDQLIATTGLAA